MAGEYAYVGKGVTDLALVTQVDAGAVANGDWVFFGEGNQTVVDGLTTWAGLGAPATGGLERIVVKRAFTGNIGTGTAPLQVDINYSATAVLTYDAGGGSFYYDCGTDDNACRRAKNLGFGRFYFVGDGTMTNFEGHNGYTSVGSSAIVTNAYVSGGVFDAAYFSTGLTLGTFSNCTANIQRNVTTLNVLNGSTVNVFRADSGSTKPTATTINVYGGNLQWKGGAITTLNIWSPVDFSGLTSNVAVTTLNITARALAMSKIYEVKSSGSSQPGLEIGTLNIFGGYEDKFGTPIP